MSEADEQTVETETQHQTETEQRARRLGWVPKEEFRGDPDRHKTAEEFLERGTTILPILQKDNEKLHGQVGALEKRIAEIQGSTKELLDYTTKAEQRAYERAKREIEGRVAQAAANADPAAAQAAMQELADLKPQERRAPPEQPAAETVQPDPVIQKWISEESWFTRDRTLNAFATDTFGEIERAHPGMSKSDMLVETKRRTMDKFPEKFGVNRNREAPASVGTPSGGTVNGRSSRKKGYEDLPAEAKRACDKFVRDIPGYTREKYVADYDFGN